jgi:hypothetical protein
MGLRRIIGYTKRHPDIVTRFYGCTDRKAIASKRATPAYANAFLREMENLYMDRLKRAGWKYVGRQRKISDKGKRMLC